MSVTDSFLTVHFSCQCGELFDLLGVPWVRAVGEAEATCAALNYHQVCVSLMCDIQVINYSCWVLNMGATGRKDTIVVNR